MKIAGIIVSLLALGFSVAAQQQVASQSMVPPPAFSAPDLNDHIVDTASLKGKVVVVNLWFINCPNCIEEISLLNQLVEKYKDVSDVVFLGLAASPKPELEGFLTKHPFSFRIIPNATAIILTKFGTPDKNGEIYVPFPMHYVLDRDGAVVVKTQGIKGVEAVRKELENQLRGKAAPGN